MITDNIEHVLHNFQSCKERKTQHKVPETTGYWGVGLMMHPYPHMWRVFPWFSARIRKGCVQYSSLWSQRNGVGIQLRDMVEWWDFWVARLLRHATKAFLMSHNTLASQPVSLTSTSMLSPSSRTVTSQSSVKCWTWHLHERTKAGNSPNRAKGFLKTL